MTLVLMLLRILFRHIRFVFIIIQRCLVIFPSQNLLEFGTKRFIFTEILKSYFSCPLLKFYFGAHSKTQWGCFIELVEENKGVNVSRN